MEKRFLLAAVVVIFIVVMAASPCFANESEDDFQNMLRLALSGSGDIDYARMRQLYTKDSDYSPYVNIKSEYREHSSEMLQAGSKQEWESVLEHGKSILEMSPLDLQAHAYTARAYRELGDLDVAKLHQLMYEGLRDSILASGDGKSPETAYHIVSLPEEPHIVIILGLTGCGEQAMFEKNGSKYDSIQCTDPETKEPYSVYFNIDALFKYLRNSD